jgi:hypothetical protein
VLLVFYVHTVWAASVRGEAQRLSRAAAARTE